MERLGFRYLCLTALLSGPLFAADPLPSLVQQLGEGDFQRRIAAEQELIQLGVDGLRQAGMGARSTDPEIRQRCLRVVGLLQKLEFAEQRERVRQDPWTVGEELAPAWEFYQSLAGDSLAARDLYVRMIEAEPDLMMSVVLRPNDWSLEFDRRCADLRTFFDRRATRDLSPTSVAVLLFLAVHPDNRLTTMSAGTVASLISETQFYDAVTRANSGEGNAYRALLSSWVQLSGHSTPVARVQLATRYQLPAGLAAAKEILENSKAVGISKSQLQNAVIFISNHGTLDVIEDLETLLDVAPATSTKLELGAAEPPPVRATPEDPAARSSSTSQNDLMLSDLALLALIKITQQNPDDYGYPHNRLDRAQRSMGSTPVFPNDEDRRRALAQWHAWRTEHVNQLSPRMPDASEGIEL